MRAVRPADVLTGAAGTALLVSMFLPWYAPRGRTETVNAWQAFAVTDLLLALVAVLALALAASQVAARGPALPVALAVITTAVAIGGMLVLVFRLVDQPGPNDLIELRAGAYAGLAAVLLTAVGAWAALSDERPRPSDPRARTVDRRPAPQP
jgi:hypothetical protein